MKTKNNTMVAIKKLIKLDFSRGTFADAIGCSSDQVGIFHFVSSQDLRNYFD
jgi:hypothetical protein